MKVAFVGLLAFWACAIVGWIANIIQVIGAVTGPLTALFVLKALGIVVAPMGSLLGWVGMF